MLNARIVKQNLIIAVGKTKILVTLAGAREGARRATSSANTCNSLYPTGPQFACFPLNIKSEQ